MNLQPMFCVMMPPRKGPEGQAHIGNGHVDAQHLSPLLCRVSGSQDGDGGAEYCGGAAEPLDHPCGDEHVDGADTAQSSEDRMIMDRPITKMVFRPMMSAIRRKGADENGGREQEAQDDPLEHGLVGHGEIRIDCRDGNIYRGCPGKE